jgi:hypothetical protein
MGKVPANAVLLHRGVIGLDPHADIVRAGPHRTTCDGLLCAEAVGIKPNLFHMEPETLPE